VDFDLSWLLIGLPVAFALGWVASRIDLRQWKRVQRDSPRSYFQGLSLLLNEQQDKAVDAFIEAAQNDPDATELHFALGNLFRRRGEFERAVRVHEHLLARGDLRAAERERAQHALAQDFVKAGLFDRAEAAWQALLGGAHDTEARLALLALYERSRDWRRAIEVAQVLEKKRGAGSFAPRIAHHWCELALEADAQGRADDAAQALAHAREADPHAPRALLLQMRFAARAGRHDDALHAAAQLAEQHPAHFALAAADAAASASAAGRQAEWRVVIEQAHARCPSRALLHALAQLDDRVDADAAAQRLAAQFARQPTLGAAAELLASPLPIDGDLRARLHDAVERAARPLQRYRCAACGFEAQQHFWQCPGCLSWDSYPPLRIDEQ
jgi:lipopolysaccharide biosynthesis regulator YciM